MHKPAYVNLTANVYNRCLSIVRGYPDMCKRRAKLKTAIAAGQDDGRATAAEASLSIYINAVEMAIRDTARDSAEEEFITKNLIEGIQMRHIDLPMSASSMKRVRKRFLECLAYNLYEI